jgi:hypothetical protein
MIATSTISVPLSTRLGDVHPLSAVLPAVLRQYGVPWPAEPSRSEAQVDSRIRRRPHAAARPRIASPKSIGRQSP